MYMYISRPIPYNAEYIFNMYGMAWPVHIEHLIYIMDSTTAESHDCIINVRNKQFILSMLFEIWIFPFLLLVVVFFYRDSYGLENSVDFIKGK